MTSTEPTYHSVIEATTPYLPPYYQGRAPVGLQLREPQFQAMLALFKRYSEGLKSGLIVLPTGVGKTKFAGGVSARVKRAIFVVPREELLTQTAEMYRAMYPNDKVGIVQGVHEQASNEYRFVVAMQGTLHERLCKRRNRIDLGDVEFLFIDEAHHATARTWREMAEAIPARMRVGMSATPERTDGADLSNLFEEIVYQMSLRDAIAQRYLVPPIVTRIKTNISLSRVRANAGDFVAQQLSRAINIPARNELVVKTYLENGRDLQTGRYRKAITFCVTVDHAQALSEIFNAHGIRTAAVWGDDKDRKRKLAAHAAGDLLNITNAAVLCLDRDTELLTDAGWTSADDMTILHRVANWENGTVTFEEPEEVIRRPRQNWERMVTAQSPTCDVRVTEGHRMLHLSGHTWNKAAARDLTGLPCTVPVAGNLHDEEKQPPERSVRETLLLAACAGTALPKLANILRMPDEHVRTVFAMLQSEEDTQSGTITHTDRRLLGALQALAVTRGLSATLEEMGDSARLHIGQNPTQTLEEAAAFTFEEAPFAPEEVWCVKTRTRNLITRRNGKVTVMGNTEGYDDPTISANILARPTQSRSLYVQMLGRALRLHPGKMDAAVFDFVDNTGKHDLMTAWKFLGDLTRVNNKTGKKRNPNPKDVDPEVIFENYLEMGGNLPVFSFLEKVDLLRLPPEVMPRRVGNTGWHVEPPTESQLRILAEQGHDVTKTDWTRGMAQSVIESLPPSGKQTMLLLAHGYDVFTRHWTRGEVDRALADAREAGVKPDWKRVKELVPNYRTTFD